MEGGIYLPEERSLPNYYKSFAKELDVVKNRVRNIIGSAHWASDGSHKEIVLQDILRRFIPKRYSISSGFVVSDDGQQSSKQIDILIYDIDSPLLFTSSNFVIIPRHYVRAVIEVKTDTGRGNQLQKALDTLYSVQNILNRTSDSIYTGIFSYSHNGLKEDNVNTVVPQIHTKISRFYNGLNNLTFDIRRHTLTSMCINRKIYGLHWNGLADTEPKFGFYNTKENSFNFFMSNLLNTLDGALVGQSKRLWYPSEKESRELIKERLL